MQNNSTPQNNDSASSFLEKAREVRKKAGIELSQRTEQAKQPQQKSIFDDKDWNQILGKETKEEETYTPPQQSTVAPVTPDNTDYGATSLDEGFEAGWEMLKSGSQYTAGEVAKLFGADETAQRWQKYARDNMAGAPQSDGSVGFFLASIAPSVIPTAGAIAAAPFTGGSSLIPIGVMAGLSASAAGSGMMEYERYQVEKGREVDPNAKIGVGIAYAAAEAIMERIQLGKLLPKGVKGKFLRGDLDAAEQAGKELLDKVKKQKPEFYKQMMKRIGTGANTEGAQEAMTEIAQLGTQLMYQDPEDRATLEESIMQIGQAYVGGGIMGGALGPLSYASNSKIHNDRRKKQGAVYIAEDKQTGKAVELMAPAKQENVQGFTAMDMEGNVSFVPTDQVGQQYKLSVPQFRSLLKEEGKPVEAKEPRRDVTMGTYDGNDVEIVGEEGDSFYVKPKDGEGETKLVQKELVEDIEVLTAEEQEAMEAEIVAAEMAAQQQPQQPVAEQPDQRQGEGMIQDPQTGEMVYPEDSNYEQVKQAAEQVQDVSLAVGSGSNKQRVNLKPEYDGSYIVSSVTRDQNGEEVQIPLSEMTGTEVDQVKADLEKELAVRGEYTIETFSLDPTDLSAPMEIMVVPAEGNQVESQPNGEGVDTNESEIGDSEPNTEEVSNEEVEESGTGVSGEDSSVIKAVNKNIERLESAESPEEALTAVHQFRLRQKTSPESQSVQGAAEQFDKREQELKDQGYEIEDLTGRKYDDGLNVKATFKTDPSLSEGEEVITRVVKPQIMKDGKVTQFAEIVVSVGESTSELTDESSQGFSESDYSFDTFTDLQTEGAEYDLEQPARGLGRDGYHIQVDKDTFISGLVQNADFPGEPSSPDMGEVFMLNVGKKGKGIGTSLMLDALRLMKENGVNTVKFTVPSSEGRPFNQTLINKGYITEIQKADSGTTKYEISDTVLNESSQNENIEAAKPEGSVLNPVAPDVGQVNPEFQNVEKVEGREHTRTLENGEKRDSQFMVVPLDSILSSHNEVTFKQTEGYPVLENGSTPNDNDYQNSKTARDKVIDIAQNLDTRVLEDKIPTISTDGIVVDGNNRTMSMRRAANNNSDRWQEYQEELRLRSDQYGIEADAINMMSNPVLVRVDKNVQKYDTDTYAKYNQQPNKEKSDVDRAVIASKKMSAEDLRRLTALIDFDQYGTINEALNNRNTGKAVIDLLQNQGLIDANERVRFYDAESGAVTTAGKTFVSMVARGSLLTERALRNSNIDGVRSISNAIETALPILIKIRAEYPQFDLSPYISQAINAERMRTEKGLDIDELYAQQAMFSDMSLDKDTALMHFLMKKGSTNFKRAMEVYLKGAQSNDGNQLFESEQKDQNGLLDDVISYLTNKYDSRDDKQTIQRIERLNRPEGQGDSQSDTGNSGQTEQQGSGASESDQKPTRQQELKSKEDKAKGELDDLIQEFGDKFGNNLNVGLDPEAINLSAKIIAKGAELGYIKFQQVATYIVDRFGADFWRNIFPNFSAAYLANMRLNGNPNNEDANEIMNSSAEDFIQQEEVQEEREYSSTQVNITGEAAEQAIQFANSIPEGELYTDGSGKFGAETEPHVTALFGLTADNATQVRDLLEGFGPIEVTFGEASLFKNEKYDVLKVEVDSPDLVRVNKLLRDNVEYENDYPDYQPHMTIAYLKPGEGDKYSGDSRLEGQSTTINELLFSGKDRQKTPISLISEEQAEGGTQRAGLTREDIKDVNLWLEDGLGDITFNDGTIASFNYMDNMPSNEGQAITQAIIAANMYQGESNETKVINGIQISPGDKLVDFAKLSRENIEEADRKVRERSTGFNDKVYVPSMKEASGTTTRGNDTVGEIDFSDGLRIRYEDVSQKQVFDALNRGEFVSGLTIIQQPTDGTTVKLNTNQGGVTATEGSLFGDNTDTIQPNSTPSNEEIKEITNQEKVWNTLSSDEKGELRQTVGRLGAITKKEVVERASENTDEWSLSGTEIISEKTFYQVGSTGVKYYNALTDSGQQEGSTDYDIEKDTRLVNLDKPSERVWFADEMNNDRIVLDYVFNDGNKLRQDKRYVAPETFEKQYRVVENENQAKRVNKANRDNASLFLGGESLQEKATRLADDSGVDLVEPATLKSANEAENNDITGTEETNESTTTNNLEPDSPRTTSQDGVGEEDVQPDGSGDRSGTGQGSQDLIREGLEQQSDNSVLDGAADATGKRGDQDIYTDGEQSGTDADDAGSNDSRGSSAINDGGVQADGQPAEGTDGDAQSSQGKSGAQLTFEQKLARQREAENKPVFVADKENIKETLPVLFPSQQDDVLKAEKRFSQPSTFINPTTGMMFTNGTGTGKTYSGLGIAKRFHKQGKKNILIVVPTDHKAKDWIDDGKNLMLDVRQLEDTQDGGKDGEVVVTTYANFRQNEALKERSLDLVMYDESHKIMSSQSADNTAANQAHRYITNAPSQIKNKATDQIVGPHPAKQYGTRDELQRRLEDPVFEKQYQEEVDAYYEALEENKEAITERADELYDSTKVVFLSATPFSYVFNLEYADGYLYQIQEGAPNDFTGYNQPGPYEDFFISNFGYKMRYNRLEQPDAEVDVSLMEREFHEKLQESGALSKRVLDLDYDYSRDFIMVDDELGSEIDRGLDVISRRENGNQVFPTLSGIVDKRFNWVRKNQTLEAIKAKKSIPRLEQHLKEGRKVVVFHTYRSHDPTHIFDFSELKARLEGFLENGDMSDDLRESIGDSDAEDQGRVRSGFAERAQGLLDEINQFERENPELVELDLSELLNPVDTLLNHFGDRAAAFNGAIPKRTRFKDVQRFNKDDSGLDLLVVQMEAGKEGISLHDTVGVKPRVMHNLGLPYKPTDAIQTEGRIYRVGQKSNAIFEYPVLHLNFEQQAFADKISSRTKTAENLALGKMARSLEKAFTEGYMLANSSVPLDQQGTGGKASDYMDNNITEFDKAKTYYYARQKRTSKTKAREGKDYFATPEPIGYKMAEWLRLSANEKALEPSAGHGAIARFFPDSTKNTFVEPSNALAAQLAMNAEGTVKREPFEDLHIVNKYHGIAMNPPFGTGGKQAMEHVLKAFDHLYNGGRMIAIVPDGPSMQKRLDKWMESEDSKNAFITMDVDLPTVTFERAGTKVKSRMLVIDKVEGEQSQQNVPQQRTLDFSDISDINELFDRMEEVTASDRVTIVQEQTTKQQAKEKAEEFLTTNDGVIEIVPSRHTRDDYPIWVGRIKTRVDYEIFKVFRSIASDNNGYYSKYSKGDAIPGFIFKTEEDAASFIQDVNDKSGTDGEVARFKLDSSTDQTQTEAFKQWFGDSKMVDENGDPVIAYHGTNFEFNEFKSGVGRSHDRGYYGDGFYFTFNPNLNYSKFAKGEAGFYGRNVMPVYLKVENPFNIRGLSVHNGEEISLMGTESFVFLKNIAEQFPDIAKDIKITQDGKKVGADILPELFKKYEGDVGTNEVSRWGDGEITHIESFIKSKSEEVSTTNKAGETISWVSDDLLARRISPNSSQAEIEALTIAKAIQKYDKVQIDYLPEGLMTRNPKITEAIKEAGHDGIIQSEDGDEVVVFSPTQIKSATNNQGTFDPNNPDIRLKQGTLNEILEQPEDTQLSSLDYHRQNIRESVKEVTDTWTDSEFVSVVNSQTDLPAALQRQIERYARGQKVNGLFTNQRVYLIADNIRNARQAKETLMHEAVGHFGLRQLIAKHSQNKDHFNRRFKELVNEVHNSFKDDPVYKRIANEYGADLRTNKGRALTAEEFIAHVSEGNLSNSLWDKIVQFVNDLMRDLGFNMRLTRADVRDLLKESLLVLQGDSMALDMGDNSFRTAFYQQADGTFYSNALRGIEQITQPAATPNQWMKMIADRGGRGTSQELEWIGLQDFLDSYVAENDTKSVPQEVVNQYIRDNQIQVEEVRKGDPEESPLVNEEELVELDMELEDMGYTYEMGMDGEYALSDTDNNPVEFSDLPPEAQSVATRLARLQGFNQTDRVNEGSAKYGEYTVPGGENYRELLLTLPTGFESVENRYKEIEERRDQLERGTPEREALNRELEEVNRQWKEKEIGNDDPYRSSHWDEPNVLAHVRVDDRVLDNGDRMLFVHEIQSDWAQDGRKKGFALPMADGKGRQGLKERLKDIKQLKSGSMPDGTFVNVSPERLQELNEEQRAIEKRLSGIPDMPYKQTDQWVGMAVRQLLSEASQNGYDGVAWVTGEQSADLYSLRKQVDVITVNNLGDGVKSVSVDLKERPSSGMVFNVDKDGRVIKSYQSAEAIEGNTLDEVIGKEMADKILATEDTGTAKFEGEDLEVGGEGMKTFYNSIVPKVFGKEAKRFDKKMKPEVVEVPVGKGPVRSSNDLPNSTLYLIRSFERNDIGYDEFESSLLDEGYEVEMHMDNSFDVTPIESESNTSQQLAVKLTDKAKDALSDSVPLFQVTAWHGSPHTFDKFSTSAMGTGEGAQAFGWGLYFTDLKGIAEHYADRLSSRGKTQPDLVIDGKTFRDKDLTTAQYDAAFDVQRYGYNDALKYWNQLVDSAKSNGLTDTVKRYRKIVEETKKLEGKDVRLAETGRNLYRTTLHKGKKPGEYDWLEWDQELSEDQRESVQHIFNDFVNELQDFSIASSASREYGAYKFDGKTGQDIYNEIKSVLRLLGVESLVSQGLIGTERFNMSDNQIYEKAASLFLLKYGIDGIRYPAESIARGVSRDKARGFNYVVFDENAVEIDEHIRFSMGKPRSPQEIELDNRIEQAEKRVSQLVRARQRKLRELEQTAQQDNADLFGNREYDGGLFDIRADMSKIPEALKPFDAKIEKAEQDLGRLKQARLDLINNPEPDLFGGARFKLAPGANIDDYQATYQRRWDSVVRRFQNAGIIGKRTIEGVAKDGGTVNDQNNFVQDENLAKGRKVEQIRRLERGPKRALIQSMRRGNKEKGITHEDYHYYLYARHAKEVNEKFLEQNPEGGPAQSGMTDEKADRLMAEFQKKGYMPELQEAADIIDQILDNNLKMQLAYGLISPKRYATLKKQWEHYVPLRGFKDFMDVDPTLYVRPEKREGRRSEAGDILAYTLAMAESTILAGEKNLVKQKFLRFVQDNYNRTDLFRIHNVYWRDTGELKDGKKKYIAQFTKPSAEDLLSGVVKRELDTDLEFGKFEENPFDRKDPFIDAEVRVMMKGKPVVVELKEPHIAEWLNGTDMDTTSKFMEFLDTYMGYLRNAYITYSPEFTPRNFFRDGFTAAFHVATDFDAKTAAAVISPARLNKTRKAVWQALRHDNYDTEMGKSLRKYLTKGTISGYFQLSPLKKVSKDLKNMVDNQNHPWQKTKEFGRAIDDYMQAYTSTAENMVRFSTFDYLLANNVINPDTGKPYTEKQAAAYAKNLTVNFDRKGSWGRTIGAFYLFYGATIQGISRQFEPFTAGQSNRRRLRASAIAVVMSGMGYAATELLRYGLGTGEDDEDNVDKINDFTIAHRFMVPNFFSEDEGDMISIPLPYGLNNYWAAGVFANKITAGSMTPEDATLQMVGNAYQSFNPIGGELSDQGFVYSGTKTVLPEVIVPFWEYVTNENFAGRAIRPEQFPYGPQKPQSENYWYYTSEWSKRLARAINSATGGDKYEEGLISVSPNDIEFFVSSYTGGAGNFLLSSVETAENAIQAAVTEKEFTDDEARRIPGVRVFFSSVPRSASRASFYTNRDKIEQMEWKYKQLLKNEGEQAAIDYWQKNSKLLNLIPYLDSTKKGVNRSYDTLDALDGMDAPESEKEPVLEHINNLYSQFNRQVNRAQGRASSQNKTLSDILEPRLTNILERDE